MSVANIVAFLVQELRSARRSMRTWVFAAMAVGFGGGLYFYLFGAHGFGQTSPPRLNVPGYGALTLWVLLLGVFSLTFDSRSRDWRDWIAEALNARPFANFELHAGRLLAVVFTVWLALVALALLVLAFESFLVESQPSRPLFGVSEPAVGLAIFVFLDAPPALLFWGALTVLLGSILRYRGAHVARRRVASRGVSLRTLSYAALPAPRLFGHCQSRPRWLGHAAADA